MRCLLLIGTGAAAVVLLSTQALGAGGRGTSISDERGVYLALGDSISAGNGASTTTKSFVQLYYGYLQSNGGGVTDLINFAQPGAKSGDLRRLTATVVASIDGSSDTKAVTIDIGINDIRGIFRDPDCPTASAPSCPLSDNLRTILAVVKEALVGDPGDETFQIMEYYNPDIGTPQASAFRQLLLGSDGKVDCSGTGAALGLNDLIRCIGTQQGATSVDVLPVFDAGGPGFIASDGEHPNDAGHLAIATAFGGAAAPTPPPPPPPPPPAPRCVVPNVKGKLLAKARKTLTASHCSTGRVRRAISVKVKKGRVISEHPKAGAHLRSGGKVSLVVSLGPKR